MKKSANINLIDVNSLSASKYFIKLKIYGKEAGLYLVKFLTLWYIVEEKNFMKILTKTILGDYYLYPCLHFSQPLPLMTGIPCSFEKRIAMIRLANSLIFFETFHYFFEFFSLISCFNEKKKVFSFQKSFEEKFKKFGEKLKGKVTRISKMRPEHPGKILENFISFVNLTDFTLEIAESDYSEFLALSKEIQDHLELTIFERNPYFYSIPLTKEERFFNRKMLGYFEEASSIVTENMIKAEKQS